MRNLICGTIALLAALTAAALVGCAKTEETKPDKGTNYYTGPIHKSGGSTAPGQTKAGKAADQ